MFDLPWAWAALLGFVVAAVSPAVVVPSLLDLQVRGYGVAKGIPSMVLAAASLDDVVSITGFGVALGFVFADQADSSLVSALGHAPLELGAGLTVGVVAGLLCGLTALAPAMVRLGTLLTLGLGAVFSGWAYDLTGGGSLAALVMGRSPPGDGMATLLRWQRRSEGCGRWPNQCCSV